MLRFYTNVHTPEGVVYDPEGAYALSLEGARADVIQSIREMVRDHARSGVIDLRGKVEIIDADRSVLSTVRYADAIKVLS